MSNCGLRPRSLLHYRGKISNNLTTGELPKGGGAVGLRARIGIAHGFATLGTIDFEERFDYAAIGTLGFATKSNRGKSSLARAC